MLLHHLAVTSARNFSENTAVYDSFGPHTYSDLERLSNIFSNALRCRGVKEGDRVAIWLEKSFSTIALMQGVLRLGAAYVPIDFNLPARRVEYIVQDCQAKFIVTDKNQLQQLAVYDKVILIETLSEVVAPTSTTEVSLAFADSQTAYILYTSGSTGNPKGIKISHRNALAFITWSYNLAQVSSTDRLANNAPFHFDLSVFDIYVSFMAGAAVFLIDQSMPYRPTELIEYINVHQLTVWYSVPSTLILLIQSGLLESSTTSLRTIIFAGEVFSIFYLRKLIRHWPTVHYYNFFGPTETNVCTYFQVTDVADDQIRPIPIGFAAANNICTVCDESGTPVPMGVIGELIVQGPTVAQGYVTENKDSHCFLNDRYQTGDLVVMTPSGCLEYHGRKDHMVKIRGYRVELGEIESVLNAHPLICESVVTVDGDGLEQKLVAYIKATESIRILAVKKHCALYLPKHMIIDKVISCREFKRNSNGKVDRKQLSNIFKSELYIQEAN